MTGEKQSRTPKRTKGMRTIVRAWGKSGHTHAVPARSKNSNLYRFPLQINPTVHYCSNIKETSTRRSKFPTESGDAESGSFQCVRGTPIDHHLLMRSKLTNAGSITANFHAKVSLFPRQLGLPAANTSHLGFSPLFRVSPLAESVVPRNLAEAYKFRAVV